MIVLALFSIIIYWILVKPRSVTGRNFYILFSSIVLFVIIAFRSEVIYGDTFGYVYQFKYLSRLSFDQVLTLWDKDHFFWIVSYYISSVFNGNYTIWLSLIAILVISPIAKLIRRYSADPMYSFVLLFFSGLLFFFMAGLRQTVALSFILMGGLILLDDNRKKKNKYILYLLCVASAYLFHGTSLIAIFALLFVDRPFSNKYLFLYFGVLIICFIAGRTLLNNIISYIGQYDERYLGYGESMQGAKLTYFLQQVLLLLPSLVFLKKRFREPIIARLMHWSVLGIICVSLSPIVSEMFRLSYFFAWANILLFSYTIVEMRKYHRFLPVMFLTILVTFVLLVFGSNEYYFFFEDITHISNQFDTREFL